MLSGIFRGARPVKFDRRAWISFAGIMPTTRLVPPRRNGLASFASWPFQNSIASRTAGRRGSFAGATTTIEGMFIQARTAGESRRKCCARENDGRLAVRLPMPKMKALLSISLPLPAKERKKDERTKLRPIQDSRKAQLYRAA